MGEAKLRIQWHPRFVVAIDLELKVNQKILTYEKEYNLNIKPLSIDLLIINTIYKANVYAPLFKIYNGGKKRPEEITVFILRDKKPKGLFECLKIQSGEVKNPCPGIYYLSGRRILFDTQIIVTGELKKESHVCLTALSNSLERQDVQRLLQNVQILTGDLDRELADSILKISIKTNLLILKEIKEGQYVSGADGSNETRDR